MIVLLWIPVYFVFSGGQIAVMITDFLQGIFVNVVFIVIVVFLMLKVDWGQIVQALSTAPADASLVNPFQTGSTKDYNFWYFLIGMIGVIYGKLSWQGTQAYNASAKSAHEAKMGDVLMNWRNIPQWGLFLVFVPIVAYTFLHHPDFAAAAASARPVLDGLGSDALRSQLTVPVALTQLLPVGPDGRLRGGHAGRRHRLQRDLPPLLGQHLHPGRDPAPAPASRSRPSAHPVLKRPSSAWPSSVFVFSLLFQQSEYIFLFFAITGAIFAGGSGAVIIGGLYWKRGTTAAAWSAMITGAVVAVGGIVVQQIVPDFPVNGQMFWGLAMASSSVVYVVVSLLTGRGRAFDMDRMLHRGDNTCVRGGKPPVASSRTPSRSRAGRSWAWAGSSRPSTRSSMSPLTPGPLPGSSSSSSARFST